MRARLLGGFLTIALFAAGLGGYAVVTIEGLSASEHTVYEDVFGGTHLAANWIDRAWESRRDLLAYATSPDPDDRQALRAQIMALDVELDNLTHQMDEVDTDREDVQTLASLRGAWEDYTRWRDRALADSDAQNDPSLVMSAYRASGEAPAADLDHAIDNFLAKKGEVGARLAQAGRASYDQARQIGILVSAAAVVLAVLVGWVLSSRIARTAAQVASVAQGLARGELDHSIEVHSTDELGQMADAMREMIAYQQRMARLAHAIARGDLTQEVNPTSGRDVLGMAFRRMSANLRLLVGQLHEAVKRTEGLLEAKEQDARIIQGQVEELSRLLQQNQQLHERLRGSAARTTALNEQALRRIGADLHDGPGQALAFALLRLGAIGGSGAELAHVKSAVQDALSEIRAISTGLRLPELEQLSISEVLARAVCDHQRRSGTPVHLSAQHLPAGVPLPVKIAAFRALQEALSNATRHGGGTQVGVRAWVGGEQLCLTISDSGPGFNPSQTPKDGHLGLASMRERAELLGGTFRIESSARGTSVHLEWPLPAAAGGATDGAAGNGAAGATALVAALAEADEAGSAFDLLHASAV